MRCLLLFFISTLFFINNSYGQLISDANFCDINTIENQRTYVEEKDETNYGFEFKPFVFEVNSGVQEIEIVFYVDSTDFNSDSVLINMEEVIVGEYLKGNILIEDEFYAYKSKECISEATCYSYNLTINTNNNLLSDKLWYVAFDIQFKYTIQSENYSTEDDYKSLIILASDLDDYNSEYEIVEYDDYELNFFDNFVLTKLKKSINLLPSGNQGKFGKINNQILSNHYYSGIDYHFDDRLGMPSNANHLNGGSSSAAAGGGASGYSMGYGSILQTGGLKFSTLNHEFLHRFINGGINNGKILPIDGHWNLLETNSSGFGGMVLHNGVYEKLENKNDTLFAFTEKQSGPEISKFNDLELFVMGVLEEEEIDAGKFRYALNAKKNYLGSKPGNTSIGFTDLFKGETIIEVGDEFLNKLDNHYRSVNQDKFSLVYIKYMYRNFMPVEAKFYNKLIDEYTTNEYSDDVNINIGLNFYSATRKKGQIFIESPTIPTLPLDDFDISFVDDEKTLIRNSEYTYWFEDENEVIKMHLKSFNDFDSFEIDVIQGDVEYDSFSSSSKTFKSQNDTIYIALHDLFEITNDRSQNSFLLRIKKDGNYSKAQFAGYLNIREGSEPSIIRDRHITNIFPNDDSTIKNEPIDIKWTFDESSYNYSQRIDYFMLELVQLEAPSIGPIETIYFDTLGLKDDHNYEVIIDNLEPDKFYVWWVHAGNIFGSKRHSSGFTFFTEPIENSPPQFISSLSDTTIKQGVSIEFNYQAEDADGDELIYSLEEGPDDATIGESSGVLKWQESKTGNYTFVVGVTDGKISEPVTTSAVITVEETEQENTHPEFTVVLPDTTIYEGTTLEFTFQAEDTDGDELSFSLEEGPDGASIDQNTGSFTWQASETGEFSVVVGVTDGKISEPVTTSASITVEEVEQENNAPEFTSVLPDTIIDEATTMEFTYQAEDPDGDELSFSLEEGPAGASIDQNTGSFTWQASETGEFSVVVGVTDGKISEPVTTSASITVEEVEQENNAPEFTSVLPDTIIDEATTMEFTYQAEDPDGDELSYSITKNAPEGVSIDSNTGILTFVTDFEMAGSYTIEVIVSDGEATAETSAIVTVEEVEQTDISDIRNVEPGTKVQVNGIVTTPVLSDGSFYVQQDDRGVHVSTSQSQGKQKSLSNIEIEVGQEIDLKGEVQTFGEQVQVIMDDVVILSSDNELPKATKITDSSFWSSNSVLFGSKVELENVELKNDSEWPTEELSDGESVDVTATSDHDLLSGKDYIIHITSESELDGTDAPVGAFSIKGVMSIANDNVVLLPFSVDEIGIATSTEPTNIAETYSLKQNYPNPFNPTTQITFEIPKPGLVELNVFDLLGRKIDVLVSERKSAGSYSILFDAEKLSSGIYIYQLKVGEYIETRKMSLIK